jgi:hypothetical protein
MVAVWAGPFFVAAKSLIPDKRGEEVIVSELLTV